MKFCKILIGFCKFQKKKKNLQSTHDVHHLEYTGNVHVQRLDQRDQWHKLFPYNNHLPHNRMNVVLGNSQSL